MDYDNRGKVSLWKGKGTNERAPALTGKIYAHRNIREGEEIEISLWNNTSENPRAPILTGKIKDAFEKRAEHPAEPPPYDEPWMR